MVVLSKLYKNTDSFISVHNVPHSKLMDIPFPTKLVITVVRLRLIWSISPLGWIRYWNSDSFGRWVDTIGSTPSRKVYWPLIQMIQQFEVIKLRLVLRVMTLVFNQTPSNLYMLVICFCHWMISMKVVYSLFTGLSGYCPSLYFTGIRSSTISVNLDVVFLVDEFRISRRVLNGKLRCRFLECDFVSSWRSTMSCLPTIHYSFSWFRYTFSFLLFYGPTRPSQNVSSFTCFGIGEQIIHVDNRYVFAEMAGFGICDVIKTYPSPLTMHGSSWVECIGIWFYSGGA